MSGFHWNRLSSVKCIVIGRCFIFGFKQSNLCYLVLSVTKLNIMSQRPGDDIGRKYCGSQKGPKSKTKTDQRIIKGALDNYFNDWGYSPNTIPHWRWRQCRQQCCSGSGFSESRIRIFGYFLDPEPDWISFLLKPDPDTDYPKRYAWNTFYFFTFWLFPAKFFW